MAVKLKRAIKAVAWFAMGMDHWIVATDVVSTRRIIPSAQDCMVVPLAEYKRLTKAAKRGRRGK